MSSEFLTGNPRINLSDGVWSETLFDGGQAIYHEMPLSPGEMFALSEAVRHNLEERGRFFNGIGTGNGLAQLVYFAGASRLDLSIGNRICDNWGLLPVTAEGRVATCSASHLRNDPAVFVAVTFDDNLYSKSEVAVTDGSVTVTIPDAAPGGHYEVFVFRTAGDYASGKAELRL